MAVIAYMVWPGVTRERCVQVRAEAGWLEEPPVGGISHVTWREGGACHSMDAWGNEPAFSIFGTEHLGPGKAGVQAERQLTFHPAHEVYAPWAAKIIV